MLYANQPAEGSDGLSNAKLIELGKSVGLTGSDFADAVNQGTYDAWADKVTETFSSARLQRDADHRHRRQAVPGHAARLPHAGRAHRPGGRRGVRRLVLILSVAGAVVAPATPASAHGGDAPDATAYRTTVMQIMPPMPGLSVRTVEAGARLELTNDSGRTVEVLGYSGEPYLEVRPDGTYENVHSPATYLNVTLAGDGPVPATADPTAPPSWRRVSGSTTVRWHDRRTHWLEPAPPA